VAFWITKRICLSLQRADRQKVLHGRETGTIWRHADGRFEEIHAPLTPNERWVLVQHESHEPLQLTAGKDANGVDSPIARKERLRAKFSNFYFRDRVAPATPSELEAAHHEHEDHPAAVDGGHEAIEQAGAGRERETIKADKHRH
jgi:ubiquinol-cytochrome c reductase cytochrome b subunit